MPFAILVSLEAYAASGYLARRTDVRRRGIVRAGELLVILGLLQGLRLIVDPPRFDGLTLCLIALTTLAWRLGSAAAFLAVQISTSSAVRVEHRSPYERLGISLSITFLILLLVTSVTQPWGVVAFQLSPRSASGPVGILLAFSVIALLLLASARYRVNLRQWEGNLYAVSSRVRVACAALTLGIGALGLIVAGVAPHEMGRSYAHSVQLCRADESAVNCHFVGLPKSCGYLYGLPCNEHSRGPFPGSARRRHTGRPTRQHFRRGRSAAQDGGVSTLAVLLCLLGLLLAAGGCLLYLARQRRLTPLFLFLCTLLQSLVSQLRLRTRLRATVQRINSPSRRDRARPRSLTLGRWRATAPRAQVIRVYTRFVEQASREGMVRRRAQTASQYETALAGAAALAIEDLHHLTTSFLEARYSRRKIWPAAAPLAKSAALRVRRALRRSA